MPNYFLYYAGYSRATGLEQIGLATSGDLETWQRAAHNPIIPAGSAGACDEAQTSNPCVLKVGGIYKMWYQGKAKSGQLSVCYAESLDGREWKAHRGPVLASTTSGFRAGYHQPHVLFDEVRNLYRMWVTHHKEKDSTIAYAESADGLSWEIKDDALVVSETLWETPRLCYPYIRKITGGFELWYTGRSPGHIWMIGSAKSPDGLVWHKDPHNPLVPSVRSKWMWRFLANLFARLGMQTLHNAYGAASPFVFEHEEKTYMLTHDSGGRRRLSMGLYCSTDRGRTWKKIKTNVLAEGAGKWESYFQADPFLFIQ
jgi:predicted GH43/DUF377 family glycosyl hydrolase